MPKTPRLTAVELVKMMEANGWVFVAQNGTSHRKYAKEGCLEALVVPMHKGVMKIGLQKKLMKQAGLI
jgi:predicted RNA binding protein YcfA (HicA-like mRNA interferase family)